MKKFFTLLLTIFLSTSLATADSIPDDFRSLFEARYINAFAKENDSIRDFLGDDETVLAECWSLYSENNDIDTILDEYLNDRIAAAIDHIVSEILAFLGLNLAEDGWQDKTWNELKTEIIEIHRRDLELEDEPDLRGDIASLCEALHNYHNLGASGDTTFLEIAAYLRGDDYNPDDLDHQSADENES